MTQSLKFTNFYSQTKGGKIALENLGMTSLCFREIDKDEKKDKK